MWFLNPSTIVLLLFCGLSSPLLGQSLLADRLLITSIDPQEERVLERLEALPDLLIKPRYNSIVASYLRTYTVKNREKTERMLGKMELYFPLFERHLAEQGLPEALKYIPLVESALNPLATSRSGAAGLWQIMPITATDLKLNISRYVDERRDLERSTEGAVKYFKYLYKRFGDWELALAAYNCGPGKVAGIVRRTGIKDYWKLKRHLPRETRNYVSAYIAAVYIANYYYEYGLTPQSLTPEFFETRMVRLSGSLNFEEVAQIRGLGKEIIRELNPQFRRNFIPRSKRQNLIRLPHLEASVISNREQTFENSNISTKDKILLSYEVQEEDEFLSLCNDFNCIPADIVTLNGLTNLDLEPGMVIRFLGEKEKRPVRKKWAEVKALSGNFSWAPFPEKRGDQTPSLTLKTDLQIPVQDQRNDSSQLLEKEMYVLQEGESLLSLSKRFSIPLRKLMQLNDIRSGSAILPGQIILLK
ncbi:MAG: transglycosylase SLT domain-containing protein [Saprospiraceae bacterium]|nr:transglycosylase SLT domain-containing protein [Saprospiraceae bacterium]